MNRGLHATEKSESAARHNKLEIKLKQKHQGTPSSRNSCFPKGTTNSRRIKCTRGVEYWQTQNIRETKLSRTRPSNMIKPQKIANRTFCLQQKVSIHRTLTNTRNWKSHKKKHHHHPQNSCFPKSSTQHT